MGFKAAEDNDIQHTNPIYSNPNLLKVSKELCERDEHTSGNRGDSEKAR
jgi:hypothetical protein